MSFSPHAVKFRFSIHYACFSDKKLWSVLSCPSVLKSYQRSKLAVYHTWKPEISNGSFEGDSKLSSAQSIDFP